MVARTSVPSRSRWAYLAITDDGNMICPWRNAAAKYNSGERVRTSGQHDRRNIVVSAQRRSVLQTLTTLSRSYRNIRSKFPLPPKDCRTNRIFICATVGPPTPVKLAECSSDGCESDFLSLSGEFETMFAVWRTLLESDRLLLLNDFYLLKVHRCAGHKRLSRR